MTGSAIPAPPGHLELNELAIPTLVASDQWAIVQCNTAAADLLAESEARAAGLPGTRLWSHLEGAEEIVRQWGGREVGQGAIRGIKVRREDRLAVVDVMAHRSGDGGHWVVSLVDCTPRQAAETEMVRLRARLAESERARTKLSTLQEEIVEIETGVTMIGESAGLRRVKEQATRVAATNTTVLIQGETGSGKELVARTIHHTSPRRKQAFVAVNCAALPESLIESELFGHEKGAFTGADRRRLGKFELADTGTLFLDEIAELPMQAQAKLLRVLQDGTFERVGGAETIKVDVRLVAATHRDLARQVERGRFREDLFYRLSVFRIDVPPLRERKEDLRSLVQHLHEQAAKRMARPVLPLSERSLRRVLAYPWPGNVRELNNAVERATLLNEGPELEIELPQSPLTGDGAPAAVRPDGGGQTRDILLDLTLEQLQRLQITHALESCGYRVFGPQGAAARLEINPTTLLSRMDKFGIPRPRNVKRERASGRPATGGV